MECLEQEPRPAASEGTEVIDIHTKLNVLYFSGNTQ